MERIISYLMDGFAVASCQSSDGKMVAGYLGEGNVTKLIFNLGDSWSLLNKKCLFQSPFARKIISVELDNNNSCLIPSEVLDGVGYVLFTLIGLCTIAGQKKCIKVGNLRLLCVKH